MCVLNFQLISLTIKSNGHHSCRESGYQSGIGSDTCSTPVAPPDKQHYIVAYLDELQSKVDAFKDIRVKTAAERDALLPTVLDKAFYEEL